MDVFEDHDGRRTPWAKKEVQEFDEHALAIGRRKRCAELAADRVRDVADRSERPRWNRRITGTPENGEVAIARGGERLDEGRLPDSRLSTHEDKAAGLSKSGRQLNAKLREQRLALVQRHRLIVRRTGSGGSDQLKPNSGGRMTTTVAAHTAKRGGYVVCQRPAGEASCVL
jgi:hypothetical protein